MKTLIDFLYSFSINYDVIWSDCSVYVCLFLCEIIIIALWQLSICNDKLAIAKRQIRLDYSSEIDQLTAEVEFFKGMNHVFIQEINDLKNRVQKRNPDGTFAVQSGKGHGKKKATVRTRTEIDC